MGFAAILFALGDGVASLTLNRPDRLNSFNAEMHEEVAVALATVESDAAIRALLITGAGRGFCAGQDLNLREATRAAISMPARRSSATTTRWYAALKALRKPVLAAVNGPAAGAGANLAFACDIVIAARSASFLQAFCRIGLVPDTGGTWFLPRLAGSARAMGMMLLGEPLPAATAAEWGLIWKVVDDAA